MAFPSGKRSSLRKRGTSFIRPRRLPVQYAAKAIRSTPTIRVPAEVVKNIKSAADGISKKLTDMGALQNLWEFCCAPFLREGDTWKHIRDMREFELYGTVRAVVSICDCINYITDPADLAEVFSLVNNYLDPGGVFIFDLNTEYKYAQVMGDTTVAEDREESSFIWDNQYDPEERINIYDLAIFLREENGLYRKYQETHYQRAYSLQEIQEALALAGMEFVTAYDAFTKDAPRKESERIYVIAREHGKKQNN